MDLSDFTWLRWQMPIWSDLFLLTTTFLKFRVTGGYLAGCTYGQTFEVELPCLMGWLTFIQASVDLKSPWMPMENVTGPEYEWPVPGTLLYDYDHLSQAEYQRIHDALGFSDPGGPDLASL